MQATIALARRLKTAQPELFAWAFAQRTKAAVTARLQVGSGAPMLHVSGRFGLAHGCMGLIMPLAWHPENKNAFIAFDLSADPQALIHLDADRLRDRVFSAAAELPEGAERVPLKLVHINKCPVLLSPKQLGDQAARRLNIDRTRAEAHWRALSGQDLTDKVRAVFAAKDRPVREGVDQQLYDGFVGDGDRRLCETLRAASGADITPAAFPFADARLQALLPLYKARNFPDALSGAEADAFAAHCRARLGDRVTGGPALLERIRTLADERELSKDQAIVLRQLYRHISDLMARYELGRKCTW